jgi:MarR family transcriptional regulator, organic hydroperoxide resistance regulator
MVAQVHPGPPSAQEIRMTMKISKLQEELQQKRPFASRRQEALLAVMKTADVVRRQIASLLESHGVTLQQYNVLRILRGAGAKGLPTLSIGQRLIEQTPGVTRLVDRMEGRGWVSRKRCTEDRRVVYACITEEGLHLLATLDPVLTKYETNSAPLLSDEDLAALIKLLERMRADGNDD